MGFTLLALGAEYGSIAAESNIIGVVVNDVIYFHFGFYVVSIFINNLPGDSNIPRVLLDSRGFLSFISLLPNLLLLLRTVFSNFIVELFNIYNLGFICLVIHFIYNFYFNNLFWILSRRAN